MRTTSYLLTALAGAVVGAMLVTGLTVAGGAAVVSCALFAWLAGREARA